MARNGIGPDAAFDLLRNHARRNSRRILDVAEAVVESHQLFAPGEAEAHDPNHVVG